jgi:hypothetical protein
MAKGKVVITEDNLDAMEEALGLIRSEGVDTQPVSKVADPITLEYDKVFGTLKKFFPSLEGGEDLGGAILKVIEAACGSGGHGDLVFGLAGLAYNDRENFPKRLLKPLGEYLTTWVKKQEEYTEQIGEVVSLLFKLPIEKGKDLLTWLENHNEGYSCLLKILSCDETIELSYETIAWFFVNKSINSGEKGAFKDLPASVVKAFVDRAPKNLLWFVRNWLQLKQDQDQGKDKEVGYIIQKFLNKGEGWLDVNFVKWAWDQCEGIETFVINNSRRFYDITSFLKKAIDVPSRELFELIIKKSDNKAGVIKRALTHAIKQNKWEFANIIVEIGNSTDFELSGHPGLLKIIFEKGNTNSITTIIKKSDNKEILLVHALAHALRNSKNDLVDAIVTNESFTSITSDYVLFALKHLGIADKVKIRFIDLIIENSDKKADVLQVALDHAIEKKNWEIAKSVITKASSISASTYRHSNLMEMAFANDNDGEYIKLIIEKIAKKEVVLVYALAYALRNSKNDLVNFIVTNKSFKSITSGYVRLGLGEIDDDNVKIRFIDFIIKNSDETEGVLRETLVYGIEKNNWEFAKSVITKASSIPTLYHQYEELIRMALDNDGEFIKTIIEKIADKDKESVLATALACAIKKNNWEVAKVVIDKASSISLTDEQYRALMEMAVGADDTEFIKLIIEKSRNKELVAQAALVYAIEENNWEVVKVVIDKASSIPLTDEQYIALMAMAFGADDTEFINRTIGKAKKHLYESTITKVLAYAINNKKEDIVLSILADENFNKLGDKRFSAVMNAMKMVTATAKDTSGLIKRCIYPFLEQLFIQPYGDKSEEAIIENLLMSIPSESEGAAGKIVSSLLVSVMKNNEITAERCGIVLKQLLKRGFIQTAKDIIFIQPYDDEREEKIIEKLLEPFTHKDNPREREIVVSLFVSVMENEKMTAERCGIVFKTLFKKGLSQAARAIIEKIKDKDDFITSILSKVRDYDKNITLETLVAGGVKKDKLIELAEKVGVDSSSIKDDPAPQDTPAVSAAAATPDVSVDTPLTRGVEDTPTADATDSPAVSAAATPAEDSESPASVVGDDTTPAEDSESPASVVGDDTTLTRGVDTTPLTAPQVTTAGGAAAPGNDTSVSRSALLRGVPAAGLGAGLTAMGVYTAVLPPVFCVLSPLATVAMGACIFFIVGSLVSALYLGANATELAEQRYNREEEGVCRYLVE